MKAQKFLRSLACIALCLAMLLQPMASLVSGASTGELIVNGTFADADSDGKADGWSYYTGSAVECPSTLDEDGITINADSTTTAQRLTVHQTAAVTAGTAYRFTARYRVSSTGKGSLEIRYNAGGTNQRLAYHTSKTDGWITIDQEIVPTGTSFKLEIVVSQGATLTCSVDDVSLTEVVTGEPDASSELLPNGVFADANGDGKADSWTYWNGSAIAAPSSVDEDGLHITADSSGGAQRLTVHQTVSGLDASKTYRLSGEYNVVSTGYGSLEIRYNTSNRLAYHSSKTDGVQSFSQDITGVDSIKIEIVVSSGATLTCSVSNFSLTEVIAEEEEPADDNLIQNPGYETTDISSVPSWNYYPAYSANAGVNYTASVSGGVFSGTVLGGSNLILHQTMALTEDLLNKTYTFTGEIKTEDLTGYAMFKVYIQDAGGKQLSSFLSAQVKGTSDWTPITLEFEVPASIGGTDVASIKLEQYILKGTGTAHFRNPAIVKTGDYVTLPEGDPMDSLVKNGGYETTLSGFPASWNLWTSTGGLNAVSDREVFKDGYSSLHLSNVTEGSDSRGSVHQTFTITEDLQHLWGQSVKVGQWVKTENFVGDALAIRVHYATVSGSYISKALPVASTQDWTYYEYIIDLPASFQTIKVETLYDYAQGHVWIDNTTVTGYIKATGIEVTPEPVILTVGDTAQLELTYIPDNTTIQKVTLANSNDSVVSVDANGLVTALANGISTITIAHVDGTEKQVAVLVSDETAAYDQAISVTTRQNTRASGTLPAGYSYAVVAAAQYGTFLIEGADGYLYYPDKDYVGADTVTLLATNVSGKPALVVAELTVTPVNAAPVFNTITILTTEDTPTSGTVSAADPENDALTYTVAAAPSHGVLLLDGDAYTYTPEAGFSGYDAVTLSVSDGANTATKTVTIYVAADTADLLATVKTGHSRLLADNDRFAQIASLMETDENVKAWFAELKTVIDPLLENNIPVPYNCPDGVRLDTQGSKDVVNLAFMFRVTGDEAYLDRAWLELESLCDPETYPDWHPSHLLDTAMTANGVAIAYDWLYEYLSDAQLALVENALYVNGLQEAQKQFNANHMFVTNENNWNYVCNGGFITTALAMAHNENEEYNALAGEIMQRCYQSIQYGLPQYAPEGDSIEGISYWDYGTRYLGSLMASITSATNVDNPFLSAPGLDLTALYPIYMSGKAGTYNYSDNDMTDAVGYLNLWLAEVYEEPSWTWYHKYYMAQDQYTATIYDLLYYNPDYYESEAPERLDAYYTSQAVTTMRSDFTDDQGAFLGFKGGLNGAAHGDIDIGSFVYDLYGCRWALDFGKEDYNLTGYWEIAEGGTRWNYYRKNAMGHNTLIINPENGANQTVGAYAGAIEQSINNPAGGYTILDMTDAYQKNAVSVKRGFAFFDRLQVLIRDEFTLKDPGEVYWQMHTLADVTVSADGKTATLTQDGKSVLLKLLDEDGTGLRFQTMEAKPYEGLKTYDGENPNEGATKIYVCASGVQTGAISVLLTPAGMDDPAVKPLDQWDTYDFGCLIDQSRMTLGNTLDMGFAFMVSDDTDLSGVCARITKSFADGRPDKITLVPAEDWGKVTIDGIAHYTVTFSDIAAKEMTDPIRVVICDADGNALSSTYTDSAAAYLKRTMENADSDRMRTLVADMLYYGSEAQKYFGYSEDDLAFDVLTTQEQAYVTQTAPARTDIRQSGDHYLGSRLVLDSSILFQVAFGGWTDGMTAEYSFTNHYGRLLTGTLTPDSVTKGVAVFTLDQVVVADARRPVTVTVRGSDGSEFGTVTDSIESYLARSGDGSTLYEAILKFSDSAYAYFHPNT